MLFEEMEFGSYDKAESKARKAFELYEDGNMSQAIDELETALEINPANASWHFNMALALDAVGRFEDAISEYETALQLNPEDLETLNSLAVDYTRTGQYDLAIDTFEHIQQLEPEFEPSYCNRIITYTEMSQFEAAEHMFYMAQQIKPDCALCYYNIGNSLFAQGQYKRAISCWLRTAELEPTHPQINYRIAQAYWADGDLERSRECFLAELRLNPGDIDVIFDFGLFLLEIEDIESGKEKFNRILELEPDFAPAFFYLGEIAFNHGDLERAAELYTKAHQKDNTLQGPCYRLAQHALIKGEKNEAKVFLLSEMKLASEDVKALVSMGSMFLQLGDLGCAAHCLLRAVDIDCADADAYYYLAVVSAMRDELNDACDLFTHALDIRNDHIPSLRDSAMVYLAMGKLDDAAKRIKQARDLDGSDQQLKKVERKISLARMERQVTDSLCRSKRRFAPKNSDK